MTNSSDGFYNPLKTFSKITTGLLFGIIGILALMFVLSFAQLVFSTSDINVGNGKSLPIAYIGVGLAAFAGIWLRIFLLIFFLIWLYRAFKNLPALKSGNTEYSPGWAVGWWFVPFANLVKPFGIMKELWTASDSDFDSDLFLSNQVSTPSIIGWWWGLFICSNIIGRISDAFADENLSISLVILMIYCILQGLAGYLLLKIIKSVTREQELRFQKLGGITQFQPPPPPSFN